MMISEPIHVTDLAFERAVLQSRLPILVDFWSPTCGPCKTVEPVLKKLASDYAGKMIVAKVNTAEYPHLAEKFNIQGVPSTLFFLRGKEVAREVGAMPEGMFRQKIGQILGL
jgi:thioredoxin 1